MNPLKKLASQTAIYGLSSIIGRLLNYLLVPLHTRVYAPDQYGVVTEMYSYVAFLLVILTYGFETGYFRFATKQGQAHHIVYGTSLLSLLGTSLFFLFFCIIFAEPIASLIRYPNDSEYVIWFALILAADAISAIPFARLRQENRAFRFAVIKLFNILINISLNVFWIWLCPFWYKEAGGNAPVWLNMVYSPNIGVGYVFLANLVASMATLILLTPEIFRFKPVFDKALWKSMMGYSLPLMVGGLAGITNEMFSRVSMKYQLPEPVAMYELGIFGACYKVAILMTIFIQTFRFAAEPFFFNQAKQSDAPKLYAKVMNYFVLACSFIFLGIMLLMPWVKYFIAEEYHTGLVVVPILLMANLFLGIFFNLSIWFKLMDRTRMGAWLSVFGAVLTIILNYLWIPRFGYIGASWATFTCYFFMMLVSYFLGRKHYPIPYQLPKIIGYPLAAFVIYRCFDWFSVESIWLDNAAKVFVLIVFLTLGWKLEQTPKKLT